MNSYLAMLKHVHGGTDLFSLCEACKGQYPDHDTERLAFEVLSSPNHPHVMGRILELRKKLAPHLCKGNVLLLDIALETHVQRIAEQIDPTRMSQEDILFHVGMLLVNLDLSRSDPSLKDGIESFMRLCTTHVRNLERWGAEWCNMLYAACDRLAQECGSIVNEVGTALQGCASQLLNACQKPCALFKPDEKMLSEFGEETVRCLLENAAAKTLMCLMQMLKRNAASKQQVEHVPVIKRG